MIDTIFYFPKNAEQYELHSGELSSRTISFVPSSDGSTGVIYKDGISYGSSGSQGTQGPKGDKGDKGDKGEDGDSAYDIYIKHGGTISTEEEWLASLHGADGKDGKDGGVIEQLQSDWNQTDVHAKDYIKNKPIIPSGNDEDKPYDHDAHSGLGRKTLKLGKDGNNVLTQEDFDTENTIYMIKYDFDLGGEIIKIPAGCVLEFDGGKIVNGKLVSNDTIIDGIHDSSNDTLFGVFYDKNKDILGWDKKKIGNWDTHVEFGNLFTDIINGTYLSTIQSIAITENYYFLFFNSSLLAGSRRAVCGVYDRNWNLKGYSTIVGFSHANDATVCGNYIYVAKTDIAGVDKINISTLVENALSQNHPDTNSELVLPNVGVIGIDYDDTTETFCINSGNIIYLYDKNLSLIKSGLLNIQTAIQQEIGRPATIQGLVYKNGLAYLINSDFNLDHADAGANGFISVYDPTFDRIVDNKPVYTNRVNNEIEGVCKDPVSGRIYGVFASSGEFVTSFTVGYYSYSYNIVDESTKTLMQQANSFISNAKATRYIDNNYTGLSDGSRTRPYKTIGEALVLSRVLNTTLDLNFIDSVKPYYCSIISVINQKINLVGSSNVTLDACIRVRNGVININNIKIAPSTYHHDSFNPAVIYLYQESAIELNNTSIELGYSTFNYGIYSICSYIRGLGINIANSTSSEDIEELGSNFFEKTGIRVEGVDGYITNYTCKNINAFQSSSSVRMGKLCVDTNLTLNNSKGVKGVYPNDYNGIFFGGINTVEQLTKMDNIARNSAAGSFSFFVAARINLENGSIVAPGTYYADANGIRPTFDTAIQGIQGSYGSTAARPTSDKITRPGAIFFDQTLGCPIFWNGSNWVDANGTSWLKDDGNIDIISRAKGIVAMPNVTSESGTINANELQNNSIAPFTGGDTDAAQYNYPFGFCYVLTLECAYISPNYKIQIAFPRLDNNASGSVISEAYKKAKFRTKTNGIWSSWYSIGGDILSGQSSDRPTQAEVGTQFFDTSISPARPIYYAGNDAWVDATGATV